MSGIAQVIREPKFRLQILSFNTNVIGSYFILGKKIGIDDIPRFFVSWGAMETKSDIAAVVHVKQIVCVALCLASHNDQKLMLMFPGSG